jgi:hypothetical protein
VLEDDELKMQLALVRPAEEEGGKAGVERLKEWAGKVVGEALNEMSTIVMNREATPRPQ